MRVAIFFLCLSFGMVVSAHIEEGGSGDDNKLPGPRRGKVVGGMVARLALRTMFLKLVRAFAQYFVDIFLGEIIGARSLSDGGEWANKWPPVHQQTRVKSQ